MTAIVVYLNGSEVYRNNMPGGTIVHNTYASSAIIGWDESAYSYHRYRPDAVGQW